MNWYVLPGHADIATADTSIADQPSSNQSGGVAADGEANALRRSNHRCVYTHNFARRIDKRSAGVSRIQRGIGPNNVVNQSAGLRVHRATKCADYASSDTRLEAERISDRDHQLADAQIFGVGQTHMGKLRRI